MRKSEMRKPEAAISRLILPQRLRLLHGGFPTEPNPRQMEGLKAQWLGTSSSGRGGRGFTIALGLVSAPGDTSNSS